MAHVDGGGQLRPPYVKIADELRDLILSGEIPVGGTLPSYNEIGRAHGVAGTTGAKAVNMLRDEGLVETVRGLGTEVISDRPRTDRDDTAAITEISRRLDALESNVRKIMTAIDQLRGSPPQSSPTDA